jgi:hypothetical protein
MDRMARLLELPAATVVAAVAVASLALASCDSSKGTGAPSDLSPAAKAKWDDYCAARLACLPDSTCPPSTCLAGFAEDGPLIEFVDCQNAKACGANDDDCVESPGTRDAEREAFIPRCEAAVRSFQPVCYLEPALCAIVAAPLLRKEFMHAVDGCLTLPCGQATPCIEAALAPLDCW